MATNTRGQKSKVSKSLSAVTNTVQMGCFYGAIVTPIPILFLLLIGGGQNVMIAFVGLMVLQAVMLRVGHHHGH